MDFNGLIAGLGDHIGQPNLAADSDGTCSVTAGKVTLVFSSLRNGSACRICADIGAAPKKTPGTFYRAMLEANARFARADGPTLACDAAADRLILCRCDSAADFTASRFLHVVGHFIGTAELWKNLLDANEGIRSGASPEDGEERVLFHGYTESGLMTL